MPNIPTEFYAVYRLFSAHAIRRSAPSWGMISDGHCDRSEAIEAIIDSFDDRSQRLGLVPTLENVLAVKVNLSEGTSRDVTEDMLAEMETLVAQRLEERGWAAE